MNYIDWDNQDPEEGADDPLFARLEHERRMSSLRECVGSFRTDLSDYKDTEHEYCSN